MLCHWFLYSLRDPNLPGQRRHFAVVSALDGRGSESYHPSMQSSTPFLRREVTEIKPWAETCGQIRPLIEEQDGAAVEVHYLEITDARLHYHERTDEIYYVLDGSGRMQLDDAEIELHKDVTVYVPRGMKHRARGNLKVLVVCIPRGVLHDVHEVQ
jgi:mannose-6-phosphate isomerase-like protein (cupin superfamily)